MTFETYQINEPLVKQVESILYYKDFMPEHNIERVVPTGNVFLLFELDDIPRHTFDPATLDTNATFKKAWVSGMHQNHLSISAHPKSEMLVVQFTTLGAFPIFHIRIEKLNDKIVSAETIFGNDVFILRDKLKNEDTVEGKFRIIEDWLTQKFDETRIAPVELETILNDFQNNPFASHTELIQKYPKSQKTLIQHCKIYCGLKPKTLHRIFRFNQLLQIIKEQKKINWSQIAYETGFSDQSHFIKDFQNFCGFNPTAYIRNEYNKQTPNFFPIDKKAT